MIAATVPLLPHHLLSVKYLTRTFFNSLVEWSECLSEIPVAPAMAARACPATFPHFMVTAQSLGVMILTGPNRPERIRGGVVV